MIALETQIVAGGVTAPAGFRAAGVACGIKANGKPDLALVVSDAPASAAAVFTTNVAQAAPILVSRQHLASSGGRAAAIVVNSGCANACTGPDGLRDATRDGARNRAGARRQPGSRARRVHRRDRREAGHADGGQAASLRPRRRCPAAAAPTPPARS